MVRDSWYGITGYPTVIFDGIVPVIGGGTEMYPYYLPVYEERIGTPANFEIEMEITNTDAIDYNVETTFTILEGINNENLAAFVVLTETNLESPGSENQHFVARNVWPDAMGLSLDFSTETSHTFNTVITLEDDYVFEKCEVVTFLQNMDTKEIYQGTSQMMTDLISGVNQNQVQEMEIYPNPASDRVSLRANSEISMVKVYNHVGQLVYETASHSNNVNLNTSGFESGMYIFKIETKEGMIVESVIIK